VLFPKDILEYNIQEKWERGFVAVSLVVGEETAVVVSISESSYWKTSPKLDAEKRM
jgi:hypothetical protein